VLVRFRQQVQEVLPAPSAVAVLVVPLLQDRSVTWTHLLPEAGEEPAALPNEPLSTRLQKAETAVFVRQPGAERAVRAWPADLRRHAALQMHRNAVDRWRYLCPPTEGPARLMPVLIDDQLRWSRSELAWALRTADGYGLFDGAAFLLPGFIAASLDRAELTGFGPALRAVFDEFIEQRDTLRPVRRLLGELYGTAIGRLAGRLRLDLLPWHDPFGEFVRERLDRRLDEPGVAELLGHAASLSKLTPSKTWLRAAGALPVGWPVRTVLDCFVEYADYVSFGSDELLRGLAWMLSTDPSEESTALLGRVAVTAGSAGLQARGYPFAPQTAAATVEILAGRSGGETPLTELSRIVANKALLNRVRVALTPTA
jgi:hypothetical protein